MNLTYFRTSGAVSRSPQPNCTFVSS